MEEEIKKLIESIELGDLEEYMEDTGNTEINGLKLVEKLKEIISKPRYEVIGHIVKECEICGSIETLLVINDNKLDKILARCDKCKPMELKNDC